MSPFPFVPFPSFGFKANIVNGFAFSPPSSLCNSFSWVVREPNSSSMLSFLRFLASCMAVTLDLHFLGRVLRIFRIFSSLE
ncbi:hypothetical protein LguiB_005660 [Lonicera macranthoides]